MREYNHRFEFEREGQWDGSLRDSESLRERVKHMKIDTHLYLFSLFKKFLI